MENQGLQPGFVTVEDAIAIIKKDTRKNATVDLRFLVNNIPYLKVKQNYNIRLMKTENGVHKRDGEVYVTIHTEYDKQILLKAIADKYQESTGIKLDDGAIGVNKVTSVIDQESQQMTGRPVVNPSSTTKLGEDISTPHTETLQGV